MDEEQEKVFPSIADEGIQLYLANVSKRYDLADQLMQSVKEGNEHHALRAIRERNILRLPGRLEDELMERKFDLIQIKTLLVQVLRIMGVDEMRLDSVNTEYTRRIAEIRGGKDYGSVAEDMVKACCRLTRMKEFKNYSPLVQKIIREVDVDLRRPLTLNYFAEKLNVNRSYLSDLFRREMGVTLTDYVTTRRISRAAYLLSTTQSPIKAVAEQTGIGDVHYFSRLFKEKTGRTPSEYRRGEE